MQGYFLSSRCQCCCSEEVVRSVASDGMRFQTRKIEDWIFIFSREAKSTEPQSGLSCTTVGLLTYWSAWIFQFFYFLLCSNIGPFVDSSWTKFIICCKTANGSLYFLQRAIRADARSIDRSLLLCCTSLASICHRSGSRRSLPRSSTEAVNARHDSALCHPAERSGASSRCWIHSGTQRRTVNGWRSDQRAGIQNQLVGSVDTSASQMDAGRRMWCCCSCCHSKLHPAGRRRKMSWLWFLTWQIPILSKDSLDG